MSMRADTYLADCRESLIKAHSAANIAFGLTGQIADQNRQIVTFMGLIDKCLDQMRRAVPFDGDDTIG